MAPPVPVKVEDRVAALETQLAELKASQDRTIKQNGWMKYQLIALLKKFGMYEPRAEGNGGEARERPPAEKKRPQANGEAAKK